MHKICKVFEAEVPEYDSRRLIIETPDASKHQVRGLPALNSEKWGCLNRLFRYEWFNRVWVIQEVAFASKAVVLLGDEQIDWLIVGRAASWLAVNGYGGYMSEMLDQKREENYGAELLRRSSGLLAAGVISQQGRFRHTLIDLFGSLKVLDALNLVQHFEGDAKDGFPSWIPRHDDDRTKHPFGRGVSFPDFKASGSVEANFEISTDKRRLRVLGLTVATISWTKFIPISSSTDLLPVIKDIWVKVSGIRQYPSNEVIEEVLALTFTGGEVGSVLYRQCNARDFMAYCMNYLINEVRTLSLYSGECQGFELSILLHSTFFTTDEGYMGIGHQTVEEGDKVCVLFGGKTPFILRSSSNGYELVREAYVHRLMKGEAIQQWHSDRFNEEWFELH